MARAGDELVNPVTGLTTRFRATARETGGELLQVDWIAEPGWTTGPDHVHPRQVERFEVRSGALGVRLDGVEQVLRSGAVAVVPAGFAHAAWNPGDEPVRVVVDFPARAPDRDRLRDVGRPRARRADHRGGRAPRPPAPGADRAPLRGRDPLRAPPAGRAAGGPRRPRRPRAAARLPRRVPLPPRSLSHRTRGPIPCRASTRSSPSPSTATSPDRTMAAATPSATAARRSTSGSTAWRRGASARGCRAAAPTRTTTSWPRALRGAGRR